MVQSLQLKLSEVDDLSEVFVRSLLPQNKPKNRFPNVLPCLFFCFFFVFFFIWKNWFWENIFLFFFDFDFLDDKTRVQLPEIPGVPGSDYINANYIDVSFFFLYLLFSSSFFSLLLFYARIHTD